MTETRPGIEVIDNRTKTAEKPKRPRRPVADRLVEAYDRIVSEPPDRSDFLHSVMCQVGMPRRSTEARLFERQNGPFSILLEAGKLWNGREWVSQPLPYGSTPRLVMVHLSSEAIRTQNRRVELGDSMRHFLQTLGIQTNGGKRGGYTMFRKQMEALAACRLTIGMQSGGRVITVAIHDMGTDANSRTLFDFDLVEENGMASIQIEVAD